MRKGIDVNKCYSVLSLFYSINSHSSSEWTETVSSISVCTSHIHSHYIPSLILADMSWYVGRKATLPRNGCEARKAVKSDYNRQPLGQEVRLFGVVLQENFSPSPAAEAPTFIGQDDESVSERFQRFVVEFAEILLWGTKQGDRQFLLLLVYLITAISFKMNIFIWYIKSLPECKSHHH